MSRSYILFCNSSPVELMSTSTFCSHFFRDWKKSSWIINSFLDFLVCSIAWYFTHCFYFEEALGRFKTRHNSGMSPPVKENSKRHFRKKKTGNVFPEPMRCHKPSGLQSPLKGMQSQNENKINNSLCSRCRKISMSIFREEFVSNIRKTYLHVLCKNS